MCKPKKTVNQQQPKAVPMYTKRTLLTQCVVALSFGLADKAGTNSAARIPVMAMTTKSSISVKAEFALGR